MRIFETFVSVIFIRNGGPGEKVLIKKNVLKVQMVLMKNQPIFQFAKMIN